MRWERANLDGGRRALERERLDHIRVEGASAESSVKCGVRWLLIDNSLHEELDLASLGWVISGSLFDLSLVSRLRRLEAGGFRRGQRGDAYLDCFLLENVDKLATYSAVNLETSDSHWLRGGIRESPERACMRNIPMNFRFF